MHPARQICITSKALITSKSLTRPIPTPTEEADGKLPHQSTTKKEKAKTSGFRFRKVCSPKANRKVTDVDEERGERVQKRGGKGTASCMGEAEGTWARGGRRLGEADSTSRFSFAFYLFPWPAIFLPFFVSLTERLFATLVSLFCHPGQACICHPSRPFIGLHA